MADRFLSMVKRAAQRTQQQKGRVKEGYIVNIGADSLTVRKSCKKLEHARMSPMPRSAPFTAANTSSKDTFEDRCDDKPPLR